MRSVCLLASWVFDWLIDWLIDWYGLHAYAYLAYGLKSLVEEIWSIYDVHTKGIQMHFIIC